MPMGDLTAVTNMVIEVAVFALLIYLVLRFLRETRGSGVVRGLAFLLIIGVSTSVILIQMLGLVRLEELSKTVGQSVVIGLIIVFHPEIRRAIVHLGDSPIFGRFFHKESRIIQRVLRAVARMGKERIGALIAVEREASLQTLAESGITIDAELNSFLIESVFYPKSALHDGAIVVRDDRIVAASCLLPLSQNPDIDKRLGTRHRAALGLTEETDALAIVVSEETGKLSVALGGKLTFDMTLEQLERHMEEALGVRQRAARRRERGGRRAWMARMFQDPVRKLAALVLGIGLWFVLDGRITSEQVFGLQLVVIDSVKPPPQETGLSQLQVSLPADKVEKKQFVDAANSEPITEVELTVSGPNFTMANLRGPTLSVRANLPGVDWDSVDSAELTVQDIVKTRMLADPDVTVTMSPPRIKVEVVRVSRRTIELISGRITLDFGGNQSLEGRVRLDSVKFTRDSITVVGPATALERFDEDEAPLVAHLDPLTAPDRRETTVPIDLASSYKSQGLRITEPASMEIELQPVLEPFKLTLPIEVDDLSMPPELRGQYVPDNSEDQEIQEMSVTVHAGGPLKATLISFRDETEKQKWVRNHMRLLVWIRRSETYAQTLVEVPKLLVLGFRNELSSSQYRLDESVLVTLRRK